METIQDLKFVCPKCGSFMFGSTRNPDGTLTYYCHANERGRCPFTCPQADWWKHNVLVTIQRFKNEAEYKLAFDATR